MYTKEEVDALLSNMLGEKIEGPRLEKITNTANDFISFVEAGGSIKDLSATNRAVVGMGTFSEFVHSRGGSLARNEQWVIMAFLAWCSYSFCLLQEEAKAYAALQEALLQATKPDGQVVMTPALTEALKALFQAILKKEKKVQ